MTLSTAEVSHGVQAHYHFESKSGHFTIIDLWLLKESKYEYEITSNVYNAFSEGTWQQSKGRLVLISHIKKNNLPILVSFRPKDSSDYDVKRIAFIKDLNGKVISNAIVYINNDSTSCIDGDLMCNGKYASINKIRVQYENYGISSEWVNVRPFEGLLQVTILTKKELSNFLVFNPKRYQVLKNKIKVIDP